MNRSPLALDLVGPLRYSPLLEDEDFLQDGGYGDDQHHENLFDNHVEHDHDSADEPQLPDPSLAPSQSPSQSPSAGSASSFDGLYLPISRGGDVHLGHDFDHDVDLDSDPDSDLDSHNHSQPASTASPPSSSRSFPFSVGDSPSPGSLFNPDSASDLEVDLDSDFDPASAPDPSPGPGVDSDSELDSDQDTDQVGTGSSSSSPNPDPLVDRPRQQLQSNDINDPIGPYWHGLPPRATRPARASLTPDIHPNRRLPVPPTRHHHHHPHHHHRHLHPHHDHDHQALPLDNSYSSPSRQIARPSRPSPRPFATNRQSRPRLASQPVSQPRPTSRTTHDLRPRLGPAERNRQYQGPSRQDHSQRQQAALVGFQHLEDQHEQDHGAQEDLPLQQHLRLRRARRAARVAREAGRLRPGRGNGGPTRPSIRALAEESLRSDREEPDHSDSMDQDDELIEVVFEGRAPAPPPRRQQRHVRPPRQQRRNHHHHHDNGNQDQDLMEAGLEQELDLDQRVPVIDLTEEPDSPDLQRHRPVNILRQNNHNHSHNHRHNHIHIFDVDEEEEEEVDNIALHQPQRHPRRHMAQNGRMPSLNRSDGSILNGNAAAVIDLTLDSPDDNIPANRRLPPPPAAAAAAELNNQPAHRNHRRLPVSASPAAAAAAAAAAPAHRAQYQEFGRHLIGSIRGLLPGLLAQAVNNPREADVQFVGAGPAGPFHPMNPLAGNPPEFNYQANGFGGYGGRQPTPKPDFQAPPPSRPGFTRDTRPDGGDNGAGEELVVVCPSCDNELKYSPDDEDDSPRPAKKARGKKSQEEHHFWAVKSCGHVYCKNCYDNRRKHSKGKDSAAAKTGFRFQPSETSKSIKIFCAVEDCDSEVSANAAWVGIFM